MDPRYWSVPKLVDGSPPWCRGESRAAGFVGRGAIVNRRNAGDPPIPPSQPAFRGAVGPSWVHACAAPADPCKAGDVSTRHSSSSSRSRNEQVNGSSPFVGSTTYAAGRSPCHQAELLRELASHPPTHRRPGTGFPRLSGWFHPCPPRSSQTSCAHPPCPQQEPSSQSTAAPPPRPARPAQVRPDVTHRIGIMGVVS